MAGRHRREGSIRARERLTSQLIGRSHELALVASRLDTGGSMLIRGAAGMGKTALLDAALAGRDQHVRIRGVQVLPTVPYLPLRAALPQLAAQDAPGAVAAFVARSMAAGSALVVDDLHWCDPDTLAVVAELAMRRPVVAAIRPDAGVGAEVVDLLVTQGDVVELHPLPDDDAAALVRRLRPAAPQPDVARCVLGAQGRPLDLHLLAQTTVHDVDGDVPGAALRALAALDERLLGVMASVALAGRPVPIDPADRDELAEHGLVVVGPGGHCEPRHDLLAHAAIDAIGEPQRRRLHKEAALASSDPAIRAVHLAAAGDNPGAVAAARRAAAAAPTVSSRADFLRIVAEHLRPPSPGADLAAAEAMSLAGRYPEALELLDRHGDDSNLAGRELLTRARVSWAITDIEAARRAIEDGLALADLDPAVAAELHSLRSRILCRVDWNLTGAAEDGRWAVELSRVAGSGGVAAHSALGLALLMLGDPGWQAELMEAGRLATTDDDLHNAVTVYDTLYFAHLLSGDPARCAPLAAEMIELTELTSRAWNGYFRAISLLARLHVDGDYAAVLQEAEHLSRRRLTVKSAEALRSARPLALIDAGRELDAVEAAEEALRLASDASARSMASWSLTDALWLSGDAERAVVVADAALELGVGGFPGTVNAALAGLWAKRDLGRPLDERSIEATRSGFSNLRPVALEAEGLASADALTAAAAFEQAADAWAGVSRRAALRARWAAGVAALDAGDRDRAMDHLRAAEQGATAPARASRPRPTPLYEPTATGGSW